MGIFSVILYAWLSRLFELSCKPPFRLFVHFFRWIRCRIQTKVPKRDSLSEQLVNLLKRLSLALWNTKVDKHECQDENSGKDESNLEPSAAYGSYNKYGMLKLTKPNVSAFDLAFFGKKPTGLFNQLIIPGSA